MRCLIIHNPASGPRSDEIFDFARALAQGGAEVTMRFIGDGMEPADASADVRSFDRVVVSGGDGTVSNVLDHLRDTHVPILIFPSGTANLYFNNIGNALREFLFKFFTCGLSSCRIAKNNLGADNTDLNFCLHCCRSRANQGGN